MIHTKKYLILGIILHQWLFITSRTPSPSNPKDLADILSVPSGNIRPGMLNWNRYNNLNENPPKQDGNSNKTEIGENKSKTSGPKLKTKHKKTSMRKKRQYRVSN